MIITICIQAAHKLIKKALELDKDNNACIILEKNLSQEI